MEHISEHMAKVGAGKSRGPKFVRWAVMLGIVIVLNVFFLVARALVLPEPQYDSYCPATPEIATSTPQDQPSCSAAGGIWNTSPDLNPMFGAAPANPAASASSTGYCDMTPKCQPLYDHADQQYKLYGFIFEIGLGVLAIIIGVLPLGSAIVSTGLSYGGVLAFVIGSVQYWSDAGNWLRFGISLIALAALIYIGIKRFHD